MLDERRIISVVTLNEHGVLSRISGLFAGRGYNIDSLTVAPIPNSEYSHITIETAGNNKILEQIVKQLHKLIPVLKVTEHCKDNIVEREMALIKIPANESISDIDALCRAYNGSIISTNEDVIVIMATDEPKKVRNFVKIIQRFHPKEVALSGVVALEM